MLIRLRCNDNSAEIAEIDRGHHREALYWVGYEQRSTANVARKIAKEPT
ncbi:AMED_5909 family protein [Amycolatopsis sp.]